MRVPRSLCYYGLILLSLILITRQQQADLKVMFVEKCNHHRCPVDCIEEPDVTEECPVCSCPAGLRCPEIICPKDSPDCEMIKKIDGCTTCICEKPVYSILDRRANVERFYLGRPIFAGSREACRLDDMKKISSCMKNVTNFQVFLQLHNPSSNISPYPWFKYSKNQFLELCQLIQEVPQCTGPDVVRRCMNHNPQLAGLLDMYEFPCLNRKIEFLQNFDCIYNVLAAHGHMRVCETEFKREMQKARKGPFQVKEKLRRKCNALNNLVACDRPIIARFCGMHAMQIFEAALFASQPMNAPECDVIGNSFQPKTLKRLITRDLRRTAATKSEFNVSTSSPTVKSDDLVFAVDRQGNRGVAAANKRPRGVVSFRELRNQKAAKFEKQRTFSPRDYAFLSALVHRMEAMPNLGFHRPRSTRIKKRRQPGIREFTELKPPTTTKAPELSRTTAYAKTASLQTSYVCEPVRIRRNCTSRPRPQYVHRWYRMPGQFECHTYSYPFCDRKQEKIDGVLKYEQDCYESCFDQSEKTSIPGFSQLTFKNGFRTDDD